MSVLMGFRNTNPPSASRAVYGIRNGLVIFPFDIVFTGFNPDAMPSGQPFIGEQVDGLGFNIGTISSYDWPLVGSVTPIVEVTPDQAFNMGGLMALPASPAPVPDGTRVLVENMSGSLIIGITHPLTTLSYIDQNHTIDAYTVEFNPPLHSDDHGLPVVLAADTSMIVGMVIATKPIVGMPNSFVVPV